MARVARWGVVMRGDANQDSLLGREKSCVRCWCCLNSAFAIPSSQRHRRRCISRVYCSSCECNSSARVRYAYVIAIMPDCAYCTPNSQPRFSRAASARSTIVLMVSRSAAAVKDPLVMLVCRSSAYPGSRVPESMVTPPRLVRRRKSSSRSPWSRERGKV